MRRAYLLYLAGMLVAFMGLLAGPTAGMAAYGDYISTVSAGGLNQPAKVAVNSLNGDVYVTDAGNMAVKKYDYTGSYDSGFSLSVAGTPVGIATNGTNIFVGDDTNNCVWIYDMNGALADLSGTGASHKLGGASGTSLLMPNTVTVAPSGHIFVVDGDSDKVYIYNATGSANSSFGNSSNAASSGTTINVYFPSGLAMANSAVDTPAAGSTTQYFYLGDQGNNRAQKLSYVYTTATKAITTAPTYVQTIGTGVGDTFGKFLRISDVAWDPVYSRLAVADSLQMVVQLFDSAGATMNQAFNYSAGVQGYLNVPTGAAISMGKCYVASNQGGSLVLFSASTGNPPTVSALSPATDTTPNVTPYAINYTVDDTDSATVTTSFFYYNIATPSTRVLIATSTDTLVGGTYSGSVNWNWAVDPGPVAGSYKVIAVAVDDTANVAEQSSAGNLLVVTPYDGCTSYTNAHYALYGSAASDFDGDTIGNCDELNGTNHTDPLNTYTSDMNLADTDGDGLNDKQEDNAKVLYGISCFLNPRAADSDGGGVSDYVEIQNLLDPCNGADDDVVPQSIGAPVNVGNFYYDSYIELHNTNASSAVVGDVVFRRASDGTVITTKTISVPANGTIRARVQDYTTENNISVDFVSYGAKYVIGTLYCYILDGPNGQAMGDYSEVMDAQGAAVLESGAWNDNKWNYNTWLCLRNPDVNNSVDIEITYYHASGAVQKVSNYTLGAKCSKIISPSADEGIPGYQYNCKVVGLTGNIAGHFVIVRWNPTVPTITDMAIAMSFESSLSNNLIWDTFNDNAWRYDGWIGLKNPTDAAVNVDVTYYKGDGTQQGLVLTKSVPAHKVLAWQPRTDGVSGQFSAKFASQGGELMGGYGQFFRYNTDLVNVDLMIGFVFSRPPFASTVYVPYWDNTGSSYNDRETWMVVRNTEATPIDFTVYYYKMDGSPNGQKTFTNVAGNSFKVFKPAAVDGVTTTEGSAKVVATGNITGWINRLKYNSATAGMNDSASGALMQLAP